MARLLRIEYPGAVYHVTSRGNARHKIFSDDLLEDKKQVKEIPRPQRYVSRPSLDTVNDCHSGSGALGGKGGP
jgi:hypothetical protein